jgi:hypothetical protein
MAAGRLSVSEVARPQGIGWSGMAGRSDTSGSPWPPHAIRPCLALLCRVVQELHYAAYKTGLMVVDAMIRQTLSE